MSHLTILPPPNPASTNQPVVEPRDRNAGAKSLYVLARWQFMQTWRLHSGTASSFIAKAKSKALGLL